MLHELLTTHQAELVQRCGAKVAARASPPTTDVETSHGIPTLIEQLVQALRTEHVGSEYVVIPADLGATARKHGGELLRKGFTLEQVVHDYGDLCQAITELAHDLRAEITVEEFHTFNRCLDIAIASAVTEFGHQRDDIVADASSRMNDRIGLLANELRTSVNAAMLAFSAIKSGKVAPAGATGEVLDRSLTRLSDIVERTLAEVRLVSGPSLRREAIELSPFLEQLSVFAVLEATTRKLHFSIDSERTLVIEADRQLLASAISILLQNALRFTRASGHIALRARIEGDRVLVEVEDECGGLEPQATAKIMPRLEPNTTPDTAPDTANGLSICRHSVHLCGGRLVVRDLRGKGCVFTIDLPRTSRP